MTDPKPPHQQTGWASSSPAERRHWCRRFRHRLIACGDELVALACSETHKRPDEAWSADLLALAASIRWHERNAPRLLRPRRLRSTPLFLFGRSHRVTRIPIGRVAIIATWNYPIQLLGIQVVQALMAGNRVTVKPSEHAPRTQTRLLDLAREGLPPGTLDAVEPTREAGERLLASEHFDHVVFTGSTTVGRNIASTLAKTLTPSTLELSGRDSAFILEDADTNAAASVLFRSVESNGGQTCMAPRRALILGSAWNTAAPALERAFQTAPPRRLITDDAAQRVRNLAREAEQAGAKLVPAIQDDEIGPIVRPRVAIGVPPDHPATDGDHFGPLLAAVKCTSLEDAQATHDRCAQHLTASVFTRSKHAAQHLATRLGASNLTINDAVIPTAHPGAALAGHGMSGWGVSRGASGLLAMTREIHISRTPAFARTPATPIEGKSLARLVSVIRWLYGNRGARSQSDRTPGADLGPPRIDGSEEIEGARGINDRSGRGKNTGAGRNVNDAEGAAVNAPAAGARP